MPDVEIIIKVPVGVPISVETSNGTNGATAEPTVPDLLTLPVVTAAPNGSAHSDRPPSIEELGLAVPDDVGGPPPLDSAPSSESVPGQHAPPALESLQLGPDVPELPPIVLTGDDGAGPPPLPDLASDPMPATANRQRRR